MLKKINHILPAITLSLQDQAEKDKGNNPFKSFINLIIRITVWLIIPCQSFIFLQ